MKKPSIYKMELFIIHPGIQHAPRLANAAIRSKLFSGVTLFTSILFKPNTMVIGVFKKRIKPIDQEVRILNHYFYTFLFEGSKFLYNKISVNTKNQSHNNPIYFWQQIFGYLCLARIWLNRKDCTVVCFETAGWPMVKYCKKWGIPVIMDFASISHEKAKELGINETEYGIRLKTKERKQIDYAFFCSEFCKESFAGRTSSKKDRVLYLGAERIDSLKEKGGSPQLADGNLLSEEMGGFNSAQPDNNFDSPDVKAGQAAQHDKNKEKEVIKISFIANLEYRKGLDILLDSLLTYQETQKIEVYLIGRIRKEWVETHLNGRKLPAYVSLIYRAAMSQQDLFKYLEEQHFDLNLQPSRFDSFAMVVPETMMLGIPNIVSPFVGAGEMLEHEVNGYRMGQLSPEAILIGLKWYLKKDTQQKIKLKKIVLEKAQEMSWVNYYKNFEKSLRELTLEINT